MCSSHVSAGRPELQYHCERVHGHATLQGECRLMALCESGGHWTLCVVGFDDPEAMGAWCRWTTSSGPDRPHCSHPEAILPGRKVRLGAEVCRRASPDLAA